MKKLLVLIAALSFNASALDMNSYMIGQNQVRAEMNSKIRSIESQCRSDTESKVRALENQLREKDKQITELKTKVENQKYSGLVLFDYRHSKVYRLVQIGGIPTKVTLVSIDAPYKLYKEDK